ncbi:hypothetical protein ACFY2R_27005 [Micromonospora olivasterospora]|uniref:N-acetyltransferase domain-containing protein n=1 Tax=Micromonospora olivasterospora TaxID=1880 RepID=A0A562IHB9_MICOL|nr:hypothetical protein [Micromonospora olivasterospora]TWH70417.1 hypothetical protein JD77_05442 [Micromonospora olivasterospora]
MSLTLPVDRARWCDIDLIVSLVTATVSATPLGAWLVPDERQRPVVLAGVARIWTEHALLFGDAFLLRNRTAATVWIHRYRPIPAPPRYAGRLAEACGEHTPRFLRLDRALAAHRPGEAHNHLAFLAVPPGPGGTERAEAVLAMSQRWMDNLGLPTYAETCAGTHGDLYRRHGYADRGEFPLPDGATARSLWRLPSPRATPRNAPLLAQRCTRRRRPGRDDGVTGWTSGRPAPDGPAA